MIWTNCLGFKVGARLVEAVLVAGLAEGDGHRPLARSTNRWTASTVRELSWSGSSQITFEQNLPC